jgi:hypothetical protein
MFILSILRRDFFGFFFGRANCNWVRMDFRIWTGSIKKYLLAMACIFSAFVFCFLFLSMEMG